MMKSLHTPSNLLVAGGAGFVGTNFAHFWLQHYPHTRLVVLDALTADGSYENLLMLEGENNFRFVEGDILDQDLVEELLCDEHIDTLVNFAVDSSGEALLNVNIDGTHSLLKAAKKVWVDSGANTPHRFHHVSTDEVYGCLPASGEACTESSPHAPDSLFAASKSASESLVLSYHQNFGLQATLSKCPNNFGPYQGSEKRIPSLISRLLRGKSVPIYGDGQQRRDWLYVHDHVRAIDLILRAGRPGESYNISADSEQADLEVVHGLCALLDARYPNSAKVPHKQYITQLPERRAIKRRYAISNAKISRDLGYMPSETFQTGLAKTVDWYLEH